MANVKLGDKTYEGVTAVKTDTTEGGTAEFAPFDETFAAGKAEGIEEGYANGKADGYAEGKDVGIAEGVKTEYDRFWDMFQRNGNRRDYASAFGGGGWASAIFKPKYDIICNGDCRRMFSDNGNPIDLIVQLQEQAVTLDTSGATNLQEMFRYNGFTRIPEINTVGCSSLPNLLYYPMRLWYIENIVLRDDGSQTIDTMTSGASALTHLRISGTIGNNANFSDNPLDAESMKSVITHLSDAATGKTATFKLSAVNTAFETAEGTADGSTSQAWLDLVATKPNWTISLV